MVTVATTVKTSLDKRPDDLRDKRLLTFDSDKLSRVELAAKGPAIEFGKNGQNEWQIVKPRPLRADGSAVDGLVTKLKDAKMDLTAEDAAKRFAAAAKVATVTVTDAGGTQTLEVRRDKDKNVYAKSSAVEGDLQGQRRPGRRPRQRAWTTSAIRSSSISASAIPAGSSSRASTYTKTGESGRPSGKTMDNTSVQNLIDKLRDLAATKFAEKGGGQPFSPPPWSPTAASAPKKW